MGEITTRTFAVDPLAIVTGDNIVDSYREENEEDVPVIWSEAPESRTQLEWWYVVKAVGVPWCAREAMEVEACCAAWYCKNLEYSSLEID